MMGSWVRIPEDAQKYGIMKNLQKYINENLTRKCCPSSFKAYHEQRMIIEDFFCNDVPKRFHNIFEESNTKRSTNYITEFLKSIDDEFVIKQLNKIDDKIFIQKCDDERFKNYKQNYFVLMSEYDISKDERFANTIEKFGYHISDSEKEPFGFVFFIESNNSEDMSKYIQDNFYGVVYHITDKKNVNSILKNGLRCKNTWGAQKLYLFASLSVRKDAEQIADMLGIDFSEYAIMKIDLPKFISVYKDTRMERDNCFYTYTSIPPRYIKCIRQ